MRRADSAARMGGRTDGSIDVSDNDWERESVQGGSSGYTIATARRCADCKKMERMRRVEQCQRECGDGGSRVDRDLVKVGKRVERPTCA
eukprot:5310999-Pleurochrysis_carterae.AAC.1